MAAAPRPPSPKSLVKSLQRINVSINSDLARLPRRDVSPFQQQVTDLKDSEINNNKKTIYFEKVNDDNTKSSNIVLFFPNQKAYPSKDTVIREGRSTRTDFDGQDYNYKNEILSLLGYKDGNEDDGYK